MNRTNAINKHINDTIKSKKEIIRDQNRLQELKTILYKKHVTRDDIFNIEFRIETFKGYPVLSEFRNRKFYAIHYYLKGYDSFTTVKASTLDTNQSSLDSFIALCESMIIPTTVVNDGESVVGFKCLLAGTNQHLDRPFRGPAIGDTDVSQCYLSREAAVSELIKQHTCFDGAREIYELNWRSAHFADEKNHVIVTVEGQPVDETGNMIIIGCPHIVEISTVYSLRSFIEEFGIDVEINPIPRDKIDYHKLYYI